MQNEYPQGIGLEVEYPSRQFVHSTAYGAEEEAGYWRRVGFVRAGERLYAVRASEQPLPGGDTEYLVEHAQVEELPDGGRVNADLQNFDAEESAVREFESLPRLDDAFRSIWPGPATSEQGRVSA